MEERRTTGRPGAALGERRLSVAVNSLFSAWMLAFLFEGQVFYALAASFEFDPGVMVTGGVAAHFAGLLAAGFLVKTRRAARRLFLWAYPLCFAISILFFFPPSPLWLPAIIAASLLAGGCVAAWGFYFRSGTVRHGRIRTAADMLALSNALMILLNMTAIHLSPRAGLGLSLLMLLGAFLAALRLPAGAETAPPGASRRTEATVSIAAPLAFLCLFVAMITVNSGLMYQVVTPAFSHLNWLASWYWAIPYVAAILIVRNLPRRINRAYLLYVAIAMIGFAFIGFMALDRSAGAYLAVNTLMMGAFGVYDLFWWSILGEMLDLHKNPAKILGIGLAANVLGVLLGGLVGRGILAGGAANPNSTLLALGVVCVTLALLPPLHKRLSALLKGHAYLAAFSELPPGEQSRLAGKFHRVADLSERESQVASLLLEKKTYKAIGEELFISENTVKYYVKNIYSKCGVGSRGEFIGKILAGEE